MKAASTSISAGPLALPNLLTYSRIAAVPVVVALMYWQSILEGGLWLRWAALAVFIAAAITDVLDGYFARIYRQQSSLGRMLDPIADKLLVASCLLMLAAEAPVLDATMPPAPGRFSMTNCWPRRSASFWARMRVVVSATPPGP